MVERRADRCGLFLGHGKHLPSMEMLAAKGKLIIGVPPKSMQPVSSHARAVVRLGEGGGTAVMHGPTSRVLRDDSSKLYDSMRKFGGH